ncbi:HTH-type transcriptional repressor KstR [Variibacter gotjawalensis]|uniref:HTH-type transcriptional repressor KstR n=1 Tax=Variibacter gotjawalensis TaxID=1333996 RepID=A0A0S3PRA7_9BRAD|nr:TetR/AcrR family transcriptional regulator [Variibacter gotjawalensis]NIK48746.1 AcrR family transcriptional regulator [Variibacter gotjawalensis]RZS50607.1 TetR family transcriptional regulator [Variibacter gotjawalensis]BAT58441.1 HTH-type transcriptional repressor KstR [Variibacter gotjawalensis]
MAYRQTERVRQRLAARHKSLIDAARAIAAEQGMDAVQIVPVADRAEIAAGTVYRYFASKSALVEALVADVADSELAAMRNAADAAPGPLSALAAAIVTFAARAVRHRRLAWAVLSEPVDAEIDRARQAFRKELVAEFEKRIVAARASGHLADTDPALAAPALTGALLEGLVGPLAPTASEKDAVRVLALFGLRGVGIVDARARGLVVQSVMPAAEAS